MPPTFNGQELYAGNCGAQMCRANCAPAPGQELPAAIARRAYHADQLPLPLETLRSLSAATSGSMMCNACFLAS